MSDDEMIAVMVKSRELCRQLIATYESVHTGGERGGAGIVDDVNGLTGADRTASQMLACLCKIPGRPAELLADGSRRPYVTRLLKEIAALLDRLMILEREVRNAAVAPGTRRCAGPAPGALRAYGA